MFGRFTDKAEWLVGALLAVAIIAAVLA